jgi:L-amino acid N-acyltransferase YncA
MTPTTVERKLTIRDATLADAEAICRIYNQGIDDRVATLETETRTPAERREWLAARGPRHPVLVSETTQPPTISSRSPTALATQPLTILSSPPTARAQHAAPAPTGWASLNRFNPRPVYDHVADLSVYVDRAWRGHGVGRALLGALIERARTIGYHKLVLAAFPDNMAGMALYTRLGFTRVGVYHEQGLLDGRWVDVVVMERLL